MDMRVIDYAKPGIRRWRLVDFAVVAAVMVVFLSMQVLPRSFVEDEPVPLITLLYCWQLVGDNHEHLLYLLASLVHGGIFSMLVTPLWVATRRRWPVTGLILLGCVTAGYLGLLFLLPKTDIVL